MMLHIYVDADACPVKNEVYRVAGRYQLKVTLVANSWMQVAMAPSIHLEVVADGLDMADDWIAEHVELDDVVITADIPLADRCVKEGARVLTPAGKPFNEENIGEALATRDLLSELREGGAVTGGPPPFQKQDRSRFLQELDTVVQAIRRKYPG
jgi:uncharacterized protein YaiI (UPF0178 family)